ncbi:MAG: hypothetical protein CL460_00895 [Acidimicrobiaceae bacterium]|nr:hypothetical protein [Acidimicrobiaceae bacterium]
MAPNRSRLLVLTVALLLGIAALIQVVSGSSNNETTSAASPPLDEGEVETAAAISSANSLAGDTSSTTSTLVPASLSTTTTSVQHSVSIATSDEGAMTISGHGDNVVTVGDDWLNFRTAIYRSKTPDSELIIELREDQITVASFGHSNSSWPIQGIRWLDDITQGVREIAVTASGGWEIDLLPDAFLWNQQINAGNTPHPEDLFLFSSQGLRFVGSQETPSAEGIGDLMIYNACEAPCKEGRTTWIFELDPVCSDAPAVFIREIGNPFFERMSLAKSGLGGEPLEVSLDKNDWLQVLTPCGWSANPTTG